MRLRSKRLETAARRVLSAKDRYDNRTDEDGLTLVEAWCQQGHFAREPDFPVALALFRVALQHTRTPIDRPFGPPADFLPTLAD
jgi:hypothetical protein